MSTSFERRARPYGLLVAQDFTADGLHRKWGADISYIWTAEGWLYLAVVLDLF